MLAVLAIANVANAGFILSVDGVVDPEDSTVYVLDSETVIIDIHAVNETGSTGGWLLIQGPGSIDASNPTNLWEQSSANNMSDPPLPTYISVLANSFGIQGVVDIIEWEVKDTSDPFDDPGTGKMIDGLIFHCNGTDDVILTLMDLELTVFDTQVIHQTPEPLSIALLGLGGLFLRRRK